MRLSVDPSDPGYGPGCFKAKVFLHGVELPNCITADEEAGEVIVFKLDADGRPVIDAGNAVHEVQRGVVKIEMPS